MTPFQKVHVVLEKATRRRPPGTARGTVWVSKWLQSHSKVIQKSPKSHPKVIQKSSQGQLKVIPKSSQGHPKVISRSSQNRPEVSFSVAWLVEQMFRPRNQKKDPKSTKHRLATIAFPLFLCKSVLGPYKLVLISSNNPLFSSSRKMMFHTRATSNL